jgi:hypothetical protein
MAPTAGLAGGLVPMGSSVRKTAKLVYENPQRGAGRESTDVLIQFTFLVCRFFPGRQSQANRA